VTVAALDFPPLTTTERRILDELEKNVMTPSDLASRIGVSDAREAIWRLVAVGKIKLDNDLRLVPSTGGQER
jgi:hypothetical protein